GRGLLVGRLRRARARLFSRRRALAVVEAAVTLLLARPVAHAYRVLDLVLHAHDLLLGLVLEVRELTLRGGLRGAEHLALLSADRHEHAEDDPRGHRADGGQGRVVLGKPPRRLE